MRSLDWVVWIEDALLVDYVQTLLLSDSPVRDAFTLSLQDPRFRFTKTWLSADVDQCLRQYILGPKDISDKFRVLAPEGASLADLASMLKSLLETKTQAD